MSISENDLDAFDLGDSRAVIALARNQIGVSDSPPGSNVNKYTTWFGVNTGWAAIFVSWLFNEYGKPNLVDQTASVTQQGKWFQNRERWGDRPRLGAIVYFGSPTTFTHTGIVETVTSDTSFGTIEGNRNGSVQRVQRDLTNVAGFGYPVYPVVVPLSAEVSVSALVAAAKDLDGVSADDQVRTIQAALGREDLLSSDSDGHFGPVTSTAYAEWQRRCGFSGDAADGIPGEASLKKLGDKYGFTIVE
jgi:hypothetical protein